MAKQIDHENNAPGIIYMDEVTKILIVDDKPENLFALRKVLKHLNLEIIEAASGNDALKATLRHDFALALLDIQMPDMDGYELAGILRGETKTASLPFIFISAVYTDNFNIFKGYEKGAFSFITKPFQPEILLNKVKFFIEKRQQEIAVSRLNKDLSDKINELKITNEELESFSYSVSHDLRSPLRTILGFSDILKEEHNDMLNDDGKLLVAKICRNAAKMSNLIDCLLNLSMLGRKELIKVNIDMNLLVAEIVEEFDTTKLNGNLSWKILQLLPVKGDEELLRQVLMNLVSNAVKYSAKKNRPEVEIGCRKDDTTITYYVKDNGAGFNMKYKDKLFGVFQRLHNGSEFQGAGIGLTIVQRIITRHGGTVWAEAQVDNGATFYFSLPC